MKINSEWIMMNWFEMKLMRNEWMLLNEPIKIERMVINQAKKERNERMNERITKPNNNRLKPFAVQLLI